MHINPLIVRDSLDKKNKDLTLPTFLEKSHAFPRF